MEIIKSINWTAVITQGYWPMFSMIVAILLRKPISTILRERKLKLSLPNNITLDITSVDAGETLTRLFTEFYFTYTRLTKPWHKKLFEKILISDTKLHVDDLIPGFNPKDDEHIGALRALRGIGLIEPKYGGSWGGKSIIEVTSFGQVFVKNLQMKEKSAQQESSPDS